MASADMLLRLIVFEVVFVTLFSMYTLTSCELGLKIHVLSPPTATGIYGSIIGVLTGIANFFIFIINAFVVFGELFTGIGLNCGFPSWYVSVFQIPILIAIIYLIVPFVK
jgi:hypothetical protein